MQLELSHCTPLNNLTSVSLSYYRSHVMSDAFYLYDVPGVVHFEYYRSNLEYSTILDHLKKPLHLTRKSLSSFPVHLAESIGEGCIGKCP